MTNDVGLPEFLASRARAAPDGALVVLAATGLIVLLLAVALRPPGWPLLIGASLCACGFGGWGIADREVVDARHSSTAHRTFFLARAAASTIGAIGGLLIVFGIAAYMLGTWIS